MPVGCAARSQTLEPAMMLSNDDPVDLGRVAKAMLLARCYDVDAATMADRLYASTRHRVLAEMLHKAAVDALALTSGEPGAELAGAGRVSAVHAEFARTQSVIGQLDTRPAPFM